MRQLIVVFVFLCLFLIALSACKEPVTPETTTEEIGFVTQPITLETTEPSTPTVVIKTNKNDPYSYIIKEYYGYMNELEYVADYHYALYDIDGNGTEELLLGADGELLEVYAIQNGVAVQQEQLALGGDYATASLLKNGSIKVYDTFDNIWWLYYYRFENGNLKLRIVLTDYYGSRFEKRTRQDRSDIAPITEEEFKRLQKKYEGNGQVVELDWKPLAEYGR